MAGSVMVNSTTSTAPTPMIRKSPTQAALSLRRTGFGSFASPSVIEASASSGERELALGQQLGGHFRFRAVGEGPHQQLVAAYELVGRADEADPAALQQGDTVGDGQRALDVVGHDQRRDLR